jgi:hypothetical protein
MSYADPQTITIDGVTSSLPRVSVGDNKSAYQSADGNVTLSASSTYGKRKRRVLRVDHKKIIADPLTSSLNQEVGMSVYLVFDIENFGYSNAEAKLVFDGFNTQLHASSDALITKLLGGES